ncbi:MAG: helix-turn-helix domain-containing protein [Cetobacterium sp.]
MSFKRKELEVLNLIMEKKSLEEIYLKLETSERNLRYIIDNLNFYLKKILNKNIKKNKGKLILSLNNEELNRFLKDIYKNYYIPEQEERIEYILLSFLFLKDIKLNFIEKTLEITRSTLKKDIQILNIKLESSDLKLESNKNRFLLLGNEKKLRQLKTLKYLEHTGKNSWIDTEEVFKSINSKELQKLNPLILEIEKVFSLDFEKEFIALMEVFLHVSLERIENKYILQRKINYDFLINTKHYVIIREALKDHIPQNLTYELAHLTEYFISGGVKENLKELQESVEKYVSGLILYLFKNSDYRELKTRIIEYLIPAIYRLKNNFSIGNSGNKSETYYLVETYSKKEIFLPEKLGEKEIFYISKEIDKEKKKLISLKTLINIMKKNSTDLKEEEIIKELLSIYGDLIKTDI